MSNIRYNKSKTYLLPLLAEVVEIKFFSSLVDTYIMDPNEKYENCMFLLYNFSFKNPEFTAYEHKLVENPYFIDSVDIDNQVLYIFEFPEEYIREYNLFKQGKYSKYGKDAKDTIINFFGNIYAGNLNAVKFLMTLKQVLYQDNKLKQELEKKLNVTLPEGAELSDITCLVRETFEVTNIIK